MPKRTSWVEGWVVRKYTAEGWDINSFAALTDTRGNKTNERASQNS